MESTLLETFITLSVLATLIAIAPILSNLTRIPIVVVEILLGCLAFYFGLLHQSQMLEILAKVGFLFLMFLCGMEVDLRGFRTLGKKFIKSTIIYFIALYSLSILVVLSLGLDKIFIAAFPVMSLGMIMALIRDYGRNQQWLMLALRVGVIGELISIAVLTFISCYYHYGNSMKLYENLLILGAFIITIIGIFYAFKILFWWFPRIKLFFMPYGDSDNRDVRFVMMLFITLVTLVLLLDLEAVLGAFLAGMIIAIFFSYKHSLVGKMNEIGFGFFVPLFFVYVGSTIDINLMLENLEFILYGFYIAFGMILIRFSAALVAFFGYFRNIKNLALFALSDSMPLTFLVATAKIAYDWGAMSLDIYYSFIIAAMIEGIVFTILIKVIYNLKKA